MSSSFLRRAVLALTISPFGVVAGLAPAQAAALPGWRVVHSAPGTVFSAVAATSARDAWAAGVEIVQGQLRTLILHWNGRSWRQSALPGSFVADPGFVVVGASSGSNAWSFGDNGRTALRWNGTRWSLVSVPFGGQVTGTVVLGSGDVWVFGCSGASPGAGTWHFDGRRWKQFTFSFGLTCVGSASASNNVWATGFNQPGANGNFIVRWDGRHWIRVTNPRLRLPDGKLHKFFVNAFQVFSPRNVWAFGGAIGTVRNAPVTFPVAMHWDGRTWHRIALSGAGFELGEATSDGHGGFWVTPVVFRGPVRSVVLHYSGGHWATVKVPLVSGRPSLFFSYALLPGTASVWAVSESTAIFRFGR
jgi:hypothetical protein